MLSAERMLTKHLRAIGLIFVFGLAACVAEDPETGSLDQAVLTAPQAPTASATSSTRITVGWSAVAGATYYYVYESASGGPFTAIAAVASPSTTLDVAALSPSTTYTFKFTAYSPVDNSESPFSSTVSATTFADASGGLGTPTNVTAMATSSSRINVGWTGVSGATYYYIYRSDAGGPFNAIAAQPASSPTTFESAGLSASTSYCYEVSAYAPSGMSSLSSPAACTSTLDVNGGLAAPTNLTATPTSSSRIALSWTASANATNYYIYRSDNGGPFNSIGQVASPTTSFIAAGLSGSTNYCFEVTAFSSASNSMSPFSNTACTMTSAAGLIARWKFDEKAGTQAVDVSGNQYTGTLVGGAAFTKADVAPVLDDTGHNSSSVSIPGAAGDAVSVADNGVFNLDDDFSVSLWVKPSGGTLHLIGKRATSCGATDWEIGQDGSGLYLGGGTRLNFGATLSTTAWTQVGVSFHAGTATLYINGAQTATGAYAQGTNVTGALELGNAGDCGGSALLLDEVRIYTSSLTSTDMSNLGTIPTAPTNLVATASSSTHVDLTWTAVSGADQYLIYRGSAAGNETYYTSAPATPSFSGDHLSPGQTTSWKVRAVHNGLVSDFSNEQVVTTTTGPAAPTGVTATATSTSQVDISWTAVSGAKAYYIYVSQGGSAYTAIGAVLSPTLTFTAGGLTSGTTYSFEVTATDVDNTESAKSSPATATTM